MSVAAAESEVSCRQRQYCVELVAAGVDQSAADQLSQLIANDSASCEQLELAAAQLRSIKEDLTAQGLLAESKKVKKLAAMAQMRSKTKKMASKTKQKAVQQQQAKSWRSSLAADLDPTVRTAPLAAHSTHRGSLEQCTQVRSTADDHLPESLAKSWSATDLQAVALGANLKAVAADFLSGAASGEDVLIELCDTSSMTVRELADLLCTMPPGEREKMFDLMSAQSRGLVTMEIAQNATRARREKAKVAAVKAAHKTRRRSSDQGSRLRMNAITASKEVPASAEDLAALGFLQMKRRLVQNGFEKLVVDKCVSKAELLLLAQSGSMQGTQGKGMEHLDFTIDWAEQDGAQDGEQDGAQDGEQDGAQDGAAYTDFAIENGELVECGTGEWRCSEGTEYGLGTEVMFLTQPSDPQVLPLPLLFISFGRWYSHWMVSCECFLVCNLLVDAR